MRTVAYLLSASAALFSLAQAWPHTLSARQADLAAQELANIQTISNDLASLNGTLNTFTTNDPIGLLEALKVALQTNDIENDLTTATRTANQSSTFNETDSENIAQAVINLEPVIFSVLNNIVVHKPAIATAVLFVGDLSKTVESDLNTLRQLSAGFAAALANKLASPLNEAAAPIAAQIDSGKSDKRFFIEKFSMLMSFSFRNGYCCVQQL